MQTLRDAHVLVVDDNAQMRTLVTRLLFAAGVGHTHQAADADEAMRIVNNAAIDLMLVDWKMQPVDGLEFTRMVRNTPRLEIACTPILMMTAYSEMSRVAAARDAGVSGFLRKPITTSLLFSRVSAALLDERMFVRTAQYFGPDRRRAADPDYRGPHRRESDIMLPDTLDLDLDDFRDIA